MAIEPIYDDRRVGLESNRNLVDDAMKSLVMVLLLASGASGEVILENPAPVSPVRRSATVAGYDWAAQKFSLGEVTQITEVEAFAWRTGGPIGNPNIVIYSDGELDLEGSTIPGESVFERELPLPVRHDYTWISTEIDEAILEPGTYWMGFVTDPDSDSGARIAYTDEERVERTLAIHRRIDIPGNLGQVIGHELRWQTDDVLNLSVKIHGKAVPEPTTTLFILAGILTAAVSFRYSRGRPR